MAPAPEDKAETMLICITAMNMDLKTLDIKRLAELFNALTGETLTTNAVECRWRPIKTKARELLEANKNNSPMDGGALASSKPKVPRKTKNPTDGVKTGRVTKSKATKPPAKLSAADLSSEDGDETNMIKGVKQETDGGG